jgi:hypothetical protein
MIRVIALPNTLYFQVQQKAFSDGIIPAITFALML